MDVNSLQSPTQEATRNFDAPLWVTGLAFFVPIIALALAWLYMLFVADPPRSVLHGQVTVNAVGDVVMCSDNAASILGRKRDDVLYSNLFLMVPSDKRQPMRWQFTKGWESPGHPLPVASWHTFDGMVQVSFQRSGDTAVATITKECR